MRDLADLATYFTKLLVPFQPVVDRGSVFSSDSKRLDDRD